MDVWVSVYFNFPSINQLLYTVRNRQPNSLILYICPVKEEMPLFNLRNSKLMRHILFDFNDTIIVLPGYRVDSTELSLLLCVWHFNIISNCVPTHSNVPLCCMKPRSHVSQKFIFFRNSTEKKHV